MDRSKCVQFSAAFNYYTLEEMSYEDGKEEVVTKYQKFNETLCMKASGDSTFSPGKKIFHRKQNIK